MFRSLVAALCMISVLSACDIGAVSSPLDGVSLDMMRAQTVIVSDGDGHGSGVIIGPNLVMTAKHVAEQLTVSAVVKFADGSEAPVTVKWTSDTLDIAVLSVETPDYAVPAVFNCSALSWGEPIVVIGAPHNAVWSIKAGIVSSIDPMNQDRTPDSFKLATVIDAATNPGDSGAPVFGADGRIRGIEIGGFGRGRSMGLMIQSSLICPLLEAAIN